ncbi:MAG: hypothetical protein ABSH20_00905 [Tepidisphaeraceae bacterium]|jgi:hypothetical protein
MFGNRIGFGVSVVMLIAAGLFLWFIQVLGTTMSPATAVGANAASYTMKLPLDPRKIAEDKDTGWMKEEGDSTPLYKELDDFYESNHKAFGNFVSEGNCNLQNPNLPTIEKGAALLIKAGKLKGGGVFKDNPAEIITYDADKPRLHRIKAFKDVFFRLAALYRSAGQEDKAREIYQGIFSFGVKLYEERYVAEEWYRGRNMLDIGIYLGKMAEAKSPAAAVQFRACEDQIAPFFRSNIEPPLTAIQYMYPNPADMVALAEKGGDPMWRVEGTLQLGRIKFSSNIQVSREKMIPITRPDVLAAIREIQILTNDPDPRVRKAAQLAQELDEPGYRKMTGTALE